MKIRGRGFTTTEIIIAAAVVVLVGVLLLLATRNVQRKARDARRLQALRTLQADLEDFRRAHASYPASLEALAIPKTGISADAYAPTPADCGDDKPALCTGYTLAFQLEGKIGALSGGRCTAGPQGVTCGQ